MDGIHLDDLKHVVIDGVTVGDVVSACCNYSGRIQEVQSALEAWVEATLQAADMAAQALIDAATADRDKAIEELRVMTEERDANVRDNKNLRTKFAAYMVDSDAGQQALKEFALSLIDDQMAGLQQRRAELVGGG